MIRTDLRRAALGSLVALALAASAIGPCHCVLNGGACQQERPGADGHACCEKPTGVQAVADDCCDDAPELVLAATEVPEVAPPALQGVHAVTTLAVGRAVPIVATDAPPPHPPDRTTVLLI